jgi:hypothetical protein
VEFRSYLLPVHKSLTWKKDIPLSYLEPKWQTLLKEILVYITCEGRYNRVLYYHFKLLNHFTGREPLNIPYFFYKTLIKMAKQVQGSAHQSFKQDFSPRLDLPPCQRRPSQKANKLESLFVLE